jgi:hypothetical protein
MSVEVVIPTIKEDVRTLESLPEEITVWIQRESTITRAWNVGAVKIFFKELLFLDDDLYFETTNTEQVPEDNFRQEERLYT